MSVDKEFLSTIRIEPLDDRHDRAAFSCGEDRLDNYLRITAGKHAREGFAKVYVAVRDSSVLGYYAICPHSIDVRCLPADIQKRMPRWPTVAAFYLSMVGVDRASQGKGLGTILVADAFKKCLQAADKVGGHFIVLDALNDRAAKLYRQLGFVDIPSQKGRMIIGIKKVRAAIASTSGPA